MTSVSDYRVVGFFSALFGGVLVFLGSIALLFLTCMLLAALLQRLHLAAAAGDAPGGNPAGAKRAEFAR